MGATRPEEEAALDPWAELQRVEANRALELQRAQVEERRVRLNRRHDNWVAVGYGVTTLLVLAAIAGGIIGLLALQNRHVERDHAIELRIAEQKTAQVKVCVTLENVAERQLCIVNLGLPRESGQ